MSRDLPIMRYYQVFLLLIAFSMAASSTAAENANLQSEVDVWGTFLKPKHFGDREIVEGKSVVELRIPQRAEDAGVVPISLNAKFPQTADKFIERVYVFVDKNPKPLAGLFHLTPEMGKADLAMRLRINEYTTVRVVAETNDGQLHMDSGFTRASGGCSEPPPFLKLKEARANAGKMKFRASKSEDDATALGQLIISHPNVTGLQLNQRTRAFIPPHYVTKVVISFNGTHIMTAETDISISEDPSFRFFFQPAEGGVITAEMTDSKGQSSKHSFDVEGI